MDTAVILAGGKSSRMGRDKLELAVGAQTLLESVVSRFGAQFKEVYLSVADAQKYSHVSVRKVVDVFPGAGPMSGLHAALKNLPDDGIFLVAADMHCCCPRTAKRIIELCGEKSACVIKLSDGRVEPLFAYYKKKLLRHCEEAIQSGDYRMTKIIMGADTRFTNTSELGSLWDEKMLLNINYPDDYKELKEKMPELFGKICS